MILMHVLPTLFSIVWTKFCPKLETTCYRILIKLLCADPYEFCYHVTH